MKLAMGVTSLTFSVPGGMLTAAVLFVLLAVVVFLEGRRLRQSRLPQARRRVLLSLRFLTATLGWLVASQPTWREAVRAEGQARVVVLLDRSRSMAIEEGSTTRGQQAWTVAERLQAEGAELRTFAAEVEPHTGDGPPAFDGGDSRLGDALRTVEREEGVGAVVVLSDGAETGEAYLPGPLAPRVFTVPVGSPTLRDDAILAVQADPVAFLRQPAQVRVRIRRTGVDGSAGALPVRLWEGQRLLGERIVTVDAQGHGEVVFHHTPERLGRAVYRVSIPVDTSANPDRVAANNERLLMVRVTRDRLRVLLVAGRPSWDVRFMRAFLEEDASIDLISFFILRSTADMPAAAQAELALIPFPTDELFREHLGSFDVILFQDFDYGPYEMAGYLPGIARYIRRGGSFAMIGGEGSFGAGGYGATPIADVLPVLFDDVDRPERGVVFGDFEPRLGDAFGFHPLIRLHDEAATNGRAWTGLAPLAGVNRIREARDGALTLLSHPDGMPVLVTHEIDRGRVLALTADSSWRWGMTSAGDSGDGSHYARFWDRALRWLARDPSLDAARLHTDEERYAPGAQMVVRGVLRDARYQPETSPSLQLHVEGEQGPVGDPQPLALGDGGTLETPWEAPSNPGVYHVVATVADGDGRRRLVAEPFVVEGGGQELADVAVRAEALAALADATEGASFDLTDVPAVDQLERAPRETPRFERRAPFSRPWVVTMLLALLGAAWWLRRRWGAA